MYDIMDLFLWFFASLKVMVNLIEKNKSFAQHLWGYELKRSKYVIVLINYPALDNFKFIVGI